MSWDGYRRYQKKIGQNGESCGREVLRNYYNVVVGKDVECYGEI